MPRVQPQELIDAILLAIQESGCSGAFISGVRENPRKFAISTPEGGVTTWVYIWTLTPGGRPELPNEYRIQMTSVTSPLLINEAGVTVLMGYEPNLEMFGGLDLDRHRQFTVGSPSVQIDINALRDAQQDGLAFSRKTNDEIAVGVRPDQFVSYVLNASLIHKLGRDAVTLDLLRKASDLTLAENEADPLPRERRTIVQTVSRLSREANFRQKILDAYGNRCAVTRAQLRLVDAAHILPVAAPGSSDTVQNGIALSPTFHRAFDNGLIFLSERHEMRLNNKKAEDLKVLGLDAGLTGIRQAMGKIYLPQDRTLWPKPRFIAAANKFRRISAEA